MLSRPFCSEGPGRQRSTGIGKKGKMIPPCSDLGVGLGVSLLERLGPASKELLCRAEPMHVLCPAEGISRCASDVF